MIAGSQDLIMYLARLLLHDAHAGSLASSLDTHGNAHGLLTIWVHYPCVDVRWRTPIEFRKAELDFACAYPCPPFRFPCSLLGTVLASARSQHSRAQSGGPAIHTHPLSSQHRTDSTGFDALGLID